MEWSFSGDRFSGLPNFGYQRIQHSLRRTASNFRYSWVNLDCLQNTKRSVGVIKNTRKLAALLIYLAFQAKTVFGMGLSM
ncbi:hypothetical protein [Nostoc sp. DSM 114161]|uniref:hypothetical protein n=1 Tax=Nostoc sp. DSM 114161 TaxID=3440143 RepID=UPI00404660A3